MANTGYMETERLQPVLTKARHPTGGMRAVMLAITLLASLWVSATCACASAWADDLPDDVPRTISGTCHIGGTWMVGEDSFFTIPTFSGVLAKGTPSSTFICIDHTAAAPSNVDATYEGSISAYDLEDGWVEYYVIITPPDATDGVTSNEFGLTGYQRVAGKVRVPWEFNGSIKLEKRSANPAITNGNGCYSLKGAVYGVFDKKAKANGRDPKDALATYKTNAKGAWESDEDFKVGTYYVAETKAPEGYALDESVYKVAVKAGACTTVNAGVGHVSDEPKHNPVTLWAEKQDAETADHRAQGSASLAGTLFEIAYYDGYYSLTNLPATATRTWLIASDSDGRAYVRDDLKVGGDDFYRTESGDVTIPLGTVVVREQSAPDKYRPGNPGDARLIQITADYEERTVDKYAAPTFKNEVMRGGIAVGKTDRQNGRYVPQGAATLAGAVFSITTDNAQQVLVDGTRYTTGEVVKMIETELVDGKYIAQTPADCLPVGYYTVREVESSEGYLYDSTSQQWERSVEVLADGHVVDLTEPGSTVGNQVIRGDFGFSKVDGLTDARIGNVPFLVTSDTTGEAHVLMADENGMASTAADWNPHGKRTNANDKAVTRDDEGFQVDEALLDSAAGIWFNGDLEATCNADDSLGALPYDTYTITELPVEANEGYDLVTFSVRISRHARELDLGTVDDNPKPSIATSLADRNGASLAPADAAVTLVDTVHYSNLDVRQTYELLGTLHLVDDSGEAMPYATEEVAFTPKSASGSVDVVFSVDTSELGGMRLVAFEQLVDEEGMLVAEHADIDDEDQTVHIPDIGTSLEDGTGGDHESPACGPVELIDTVSYHGLVPGMAYTMRGALRMRAADGTDAGPARDENGQAIEAAQSFTPDTPSGTVKVSFSFSAPDLAGATLVAFEDLVHRDATYALHADIADEGQTVKMPSVGTTLVDGADGDHGATADEAITLVDIVSYHGVTPGVAYTLTGTLHVRADDGTDAGPALDEQGNEITASETFVPESDAGEVSVTFAFAAPAMAGKTVVAFEELARDGRAYAVHADISDDGQTVWFAPPHVEEGEPTDEAPPPTPQRETPPTRTPTVESGMSGKGALPRTGDTIDMMPIACTAIAALGLTVASICVRRMQKDREITINRGPTRRQPHPRS